MRVVRRGTTYTATGTLKRPSAAAGSCSGSSVTLIAVKDKRTIATRKAGLSRRCTYRIVLRLGPSNPGFAISFAGNTVLRSVRTP
jgi:hypothetical protein